MSLFKKYLSNTCWGLQKQTKPLSPSWLTRGTFWASICGRKLSAWQQVKVLLLHSVTSYNNVTMQWPQFRSAVKDFLCLFCTKPHSKYNRLQKVRSVWFKNEKKTCWCLRAIWLVLAAATAATSVSLHLLDRYEQHGYHNLFLCSSTGRQATKEVDEQTNRKSFFFRLTDILGSRNDPQWHDNSASKTTDSSDKQRRTSLQDFGSSTSHLSSVSSKPVTQIMKPFNYAEGIR